MDFPNPVATPTHINTLMSLSTGHLLRQAGAGSPAAGTWNVANLAIYYPLFLPFPYLMQRAFWANGGGSGNADIGVYTVSGKRLWSAGSTAVAATTALNYVTAAFLLGPGYYYIAYAADGTTSRGYGMSVNVSAARLCGILQQTSAFPLPATATFAAYSQAAGVTFQLCGITRTASGF